MNDREQLETLDRRYLWHPFTQMQDYEGERIPIIVRGEGVWLEDIEGNRYLDGVSSMWCNVHGHRVQAIDRAIGEQLSRIAHSTLLGAANVPSIELAERLVALAPPNLTRVFYSDDGSTAVEVALKMAFQYWRQRPDPRPDKTRFVHLDYAYHGDTLGAVGVGGIDLFHQTYRPLLFPSFSVPSPYCYRCPFGQEPSRCTMECLSALEDLLRAHHDEIAAVIVEPLVQAAGGMIVAPEGYLRGVADLCCRWEVLLIADEVATGFGRTGEMFACACEGVEPDLLCLAKGLTGGYLPLAATLTTDEVYRAFLGDYASRRTFFHGHTYTGNPLACAAALANLRIFEEEQTLQRLRPKIALLADRLRALADLPHVGDVRQCGLMAGVELVRDRATKEPYPYEERVGLRVALEARKEGLWLRPLGGIIVIMPPLSISEGELIWMMDVIRRAIERGTTAGSRQ